VKAQNRDGGFGGSPTQSSSQVPTTWAALGLAAAGRDPAMASQGKDSVLDYVKKNPPSHNETASLERAILVARAAGVPPSRFGRQNLLRDLLRQHDANGSFDNLVNLTAFGVLAMRAGGEPANSRRVRNSVAWLERQQNADGGFGFSKRPSLSDVDDTGAVVQALAAGGHGSGEPVGKAVDYLLRGQQKDGGFGQLPGRQSNAQSTAWAVQGLMAVAGEHASSDAVPKGVSYLRSLQAADGGIRYSETSSQTPVWVTGQTLLALCRQPLPLLP
jgi:prenyltransferase beta subunit